MTFRWTLEDKETVFLRAGGHRSPLSSRCRMRTAKYATDGVRTRATRQGKQVLSLPPY